MVPHAERTPVEGVEDRHPVAPIVNLAAALRPGSVVFQARC